MKTALLVVLCFMTVLSVKASAFVQVQLDTTQYAPDHPGKRWTVVNSDGKVVVFYGIGTGGNFVYKTSSDGGYNWSATRVTINTSSYSYLTSVWLDSGNNIEANRNNIYVVTCSGAGGQALMKKLVYSGGSYSLSGTVVTVATSVAGKTAGEAHVGIATYNMANANGNRIWVSYGSTSDTGIHATYSDDDGVNWNGDVGAGGGEPAHYAVIAGADTRRHALSIRNNQPVLINGENVAANTKMGIFNGASWTVSALLFCCSYS